MRDTMKCVWLLAGCVAPSDDCITGIDCKTIRQADSSVLGQHSPHISTIRKGLYKGQTQGLGIYDVFGVVK